MSKLLTNRISVFLELTRFPACSFLKSDMPKPWYRKSRERLKVFLTVVMEVLRDIHFFLLSLVQKTVTVRKMRTLSSTGRYEYLRIFNHF